MADEPVLKAPQRVSGMRVLEGWSLPGKPAGLTPAAEDAWRQSGFIVGDDLRMIEQNLDLQARMAATGYAAAARTMTMAALTSLWSRAFSSLSDATGLVRQGSYQSAVPLIRQALELMAAGSGLGSEIEVFNRWAVEAYRRHEATRAEDVGVGQYHSGESIARDEHLRLIFRAAGDLARPNFGPTALFVANEASGERYPLVFADQAFHLGWAQLLFGWVLRIGVHQLRVGLGAPEHFPTSPELRDESVAHGTAVDALLDDGDRCRLEEYMDEDGRLRHLIVGFRRQPGDATRRLLL